MALTGSTLTPLTSIGGGLVVLARIAIFVVLSTVCASAQLRVITTIPDFADIAKRIGGDCVRVESLIKGREDLHLVRIRPSLLIKVRRADVFIEMGLDAEHSWVPALLRTARNKKIRPGKPGFCNASAGIKPLQVLRSTSRDQGPDLHPRGNPHYNLDPQRMRVAARNVLDCLVRVAPKHEDKFRQGFASWTKELNERLKGWKSKLEPFRGAAFIESHSAWVYFAETFGLEIVARLEPRPGLAPTPSHLRLVIDIGTERHVGLVVGRAQFADVAQRVAKRIDAVAAQLPLCSATKGQARGWFAFMDQVVTSFATHLKKASIVGRK